VDISLFWSLFVILAITYFAIAMGASRNLETDDDFFYGRRQFGVTALSLSLAAIQIGGGVVLATAEEAYRVGLYGITYSLGICGGFFVLALGIAYRLRRLNIRTIAEIFSLRYHSTALRRLASTMSILTLMGILISQIIASRILLDTVAGEYHWILILFWLLVIIYTMFGGLKAVIATEIFQIVLVVAVFLGILLIYSWKRPESFDLFWHPSKILAIHAMFAHPEPSRLWSLFLLPLFYTVLAQDLGQRFFSARTPTTALVSVLFALLIVLGFSCFPVIFGMEARQLGIEVAAGQSTMLVLLERTLEPFFYYLVVCAIIAAISSTADAILCAIGSNVVEDFLLVSSDGPVDKYLSILISRVVILFFGICALIMGYQFNDILGVLSLSYELSISCLLIPIIFGMFSKNPKMESAIASMIAGLLGFIVCRFSLPFFMPCELLSVLASLVGYCGGYFYKYIHRLAHPK